MRRPLLIAGREYLENVRTRGFWISIFMMPIILLLFAIVPLVAESTREVKTYVVIDRSGELLEAVRRRISATDFAHLLRATSEGSLHGVPAPLARLSDAISELDDRALRDLAANILARRSVDDDVLQALLAPHLDEIIVWWDGLDPRIRAAYSARISSNYFVEVPYHDETEAQLNAQIRDGALFAYLVIGEDPIADSSGTRYVSSNLTDSDLLNWFGGIVSREIRERRLALEAIDGATADWISQPLDFAGEQVNEAGIAETVGNTDIARQWAPVVFVYLLWISILINTQMLLTNTIEEKSNKLIEVLLSSVSAIELMAGKILGIAGTGLTIIIVWGAIAALLLLGLPMLLDLTPPIDLSSIITDPLYMGSFAVYFLLGYLLYAAILVGLGSVCSNLKEAQNMMLPVQLLQMIPVFVMVPIGRDPNGTLAQVLSYVPPLTPFIMMNRAAGPPTATEYLVTTLLLIVSIAVTLVVAAKVFRVGILLSGQRPTLREIFGWLRQPADY